MKNLATAPTRSHKIEHVKHATNKKEGACIDAPLLNSSLTGVQTNETKFKLKNKTKQKQNKKQKIVRD
jgi:hypothetical protein